MACEGVPLAAIAEAVGTPVYVYSTATLVRHYTVFRDAFADRRPLIAYAVKANPNLSVIRTLARLGAGADTVSEGEIRRAHGALRRRHGRVRGDRRRLGHRRDRRHRRRTAHARQAPWGDSVADGAWRLASV